MEDNKHMIFIVAIVAIVAVVALIVIISGHRGSSSNYDSGQAISATVDTGTVGTDAPIGGSGGSTSCSRECDNYCRNHHNQYCISSYIRNGQCEKICGGRGT